MARIGKLPIIKFLIENHVDINLKYIFSTACENGYLHVIQYLVQMGYTINELDNCGHGFRDACENGNMEVVQYLMNLNCDYMKEEKNGML